MSASFSKKSKQRRVTDYLIRIKAGTIALGIAAAGVTHGSELFISAAHGLLTGDRILCTEDNTLPTGLSTATQYWIIKVSADTFKLASSYSNAAAGTAVAISDDGTGSNSYDLVEEIDGIDKYQVSGTVQATAVGTYKFNLPSGTFFDANSYEIMLTAHGRDIVVIEDRSARTATSFTVMVDAIDETAALVDGFFAVLITGTTIEDRYSN